MFGIQSQTINTVNKKKMESIMKAINNKKTKKIC